MFFFRRMEPAQKKPPVKEPTKSSPDEQFLAEYLIARRSNQRVDKEWEKVHDHHRHGKKGFKNIVRRTMFLERLKAMGLNGEEGLGVVPSGREDGEGDLHHSQKSTIPKKERTITQEERELQEKRQQEIDKENEVKKDLRERYIMENAGSNANSETNEGKANGKRKSRKLKKNKTKINKGIEFDEICTFEKTPDEILEEDKMSEPENDGDMDTDDIETYELCDVEKPNTDGKELFNTEQIETIVPPDTTEESDQDVEEESSVVIDTIIPSRDKSLKSKTKEDETEDRKEPRSPDKRTEQKRGSIQRENNFFNDVTKGTDNKVSVKERLVVMKNPSVLRSPRVSPLQAFPRSQMVAAAGARAGEMPKLASVKKRAPAAATAPVVNGVKKVAEKGAKKGADKGAEKGSKKGTDRGAKNGAKNITEKGAKKITEKGAKKGAKKLPAGKKDNKKGKAPEEKAPRAYNVPVTRM